MNRAQRRHNKKPHGDSHGYAIAAHMVMEDYRKRLNTAADEVAQDLNLQLADKTAEYWKRCIGIGILAFREVTGSTSKAQKFASRFAEMLERDRDRPIEEILAEVARVADIQMEVQD